jgi:hypothetical protein
MGMYSHAWSFPAGQPLRGGCELLNTRSISHMLADRYQVVTLTEGKVVRGLTCLRVVIKHVVVDDAVEPPVRIELFQVAAGIRTAQLSCRGDRKR